MPRTPLSVNDVVEVKTYTDNLAPGAGDNIYQNTFHWRVTTVGSMGDGLTELLNAFAASSLLDAIRAAATDDYRWRQLSARRVIPAQIESQMILEVSLLGTRVGLVSLPANLAGIVRRVSIQKGPKGNGRLFIFGAATVDLTGQFWSVAYQALLSAIAVQCIAPLTGANGWVYAPVVLNRSASGAVILGSSAIEEFGYDNFPSGMITRRIGRGM